MVMDTFLRQGEKGEGLQRLNRCRLKWELIFISDVTTAGGARLDKEYLEALGRERMKSDLTFSREEPNEADWQY